MNGIWLKVILIKLFIKNKNPKANKSNFDLLSVLYIAVCSTMFTVFLLV